jgi:hypothetical protein
MPVRCAAASRAGRLGERWPAGDIPNDALFGPEYRAVPGTDPALNRACLAEGCDRVLPAIRKSVSCNCLLLIRQGAATSLDCIGVPMGAETSLPTFSARETPAPFRAEIFLESAPKIRTKKGPSGRRCAGAILFCCAGSAGRRGRDPARSGQHAPAPHGWSVLIRRRCFPQFVVRSGIPSRAGGPVVRRRRPPKLSVSEQY